MAVMLSLTTMVTLLPTSIYADDVDVITAKVENDVGITEEETIADASFEETKEAVIEESASEETAEGTEGSSDDEEEIDLSD